MSTGERVLRFLVTGTTGFLVDAGVLMLVMGLAMLGPELGRAISFPTALAATWLLNRLWAFGDRERPRIGGELVGYVGIQLASFGVNYTIYVVLVRGWLGIALAPVAALAVASVGAAGLTYVLLNNGLYRRRARDGVKDRNLGPVH